MSDGAPLDESLGGPQGVEQRVIQSGALVLALRGTQLVVGLGTTMVLARLLRPSDFGLLAMSAVLTGAVLSIRNLGLSLAVVQSERVAEEDLSALFWLSLPITTALSLATALMGPVLAWFFGEPSLTPITACLASGIFVAGFVNIHSGIVRREMRFGALSGAELFAAVVGSGVAIFLAAQGYGVWSLVAQQVFMLCIQTAIIWNLTAWRPARFQPIGQGASLQSLLTFGKETTAARIFNELSEQLDRVLVGYFAGPATLGLYDMAHRWSSLPATQLVVPMKTVAVATFSRLQGDINRYCAAANLVFGAVLSLVLPVLAFLAADAPLVVRLLLGDQWAEAIPVFRILCIAAFAGCGSRVMIWVYLSEGRTSERLRWTLVSRPISILFVLAGIPWGAFGIATGYAVGKTLLTIANVQHGLSQSPLGMSEFLRAALRPACAAFVAGLVTFGLGNAEAGLVVLLQHALVFALIYLAIWILPPGGVKHARDVARWLRP